MMTDRHLYLLVAVLCGFAVVLSAYWITHRGGRCDGYWEASSVRYVNGEATDPVVTHGCGRP